MTLTATVISWNTPNTCIDLRIDIAEAIYIQRLINVPLSIFYDFYSLRYKIRIDISAYARYVSGLIKIWFV